MPDFDKDGRLLHHLDARTPFSKRISIVHPDGGRVRYPRDSRHR
jgi:YD repeat-containing protein